MRVADARGCGQSSVRRSHRSRASGSRGTSARSWPAPSSSSPTIVARRRRTKVSRLTESARRRRVGDRVRPASGRSLRQSFELAAAEIDPPIGPSFDRIGDRVELGDPMDDAVDAWAAEISGADARLAAGVLRLHRRTGRRSPRRSRLASTLRASERHARELRSLTAQARLSANILGLLPLGFFAFLSVVARDDMSGGDHHARRFARDRPRPRAPGGRVRVDPERSLRIEP